MTKLELVTVYKRYMKNSALTNKERSLTEDYAKMTEWLTDNYGADTSMDELLCMLYTDAMYMTITKAVNRKLKFKELAQFGEWDGMSVKKGIGLVQSMLNSEKVSDTDAYRIQKERLMMLMDYLKKEGKTATILYIVQCWLQMDFAFMNSYRSNHRDVEIILQCSTEDEINDALEGIHSDGNIKTSSPAETEFTIDSSPEVISEIRKRAYDACQEGDTITIEQCIKEVTTLYANGYFNRHGFSEEHGANLFKSLVGVFKKYIMRIEGEPYETNPLDIIKTIFDSSTEPMEGETS